MVEYFSSVFTVDEIKREYRRLAFRCHPDTGGSNEEMRELYEQYERALARADKEPLLPEYFRDGVAYMYKKASIRYTGRDNHYYHFRFVTGGILWIDRWNMNLVEMDRARL